MQSYNLLREFADSWMLLVLTAVFVGVVIWAFRPGSRKTHDDAAKSIFRNEKRPKAEVDHPAARAADPAPTAPTKDAP